MALDNAQSSVSFPLSDPTSPPRQQQPTPQLKGPHLPFRRISLPTAPTLLHRASVVSVQSVDDSLNDYADGRGPLGSPIRLAAPRPSRTSTQPGLVESPRRKSKTRDSSVKPLDERRAAKRQKIIQEFFETERAYVDGLELIYSHFLTPIIATLDTPEPLLKRSSLTSIFSNFIDIWNLHRSFLPALRELIYPADLPTPSIAPPLSPVLLAHFPYLSLYTPFVTTFPSTISTLTLFISPPSASRPQNPEYNPAFVAFLAQQESDPRCGKLRLRDWLLTIVQRCPRYLLLLKDLIGCTDKNDPEHAQLTAVHALVSKITLSLNTSLQTHAQTLALLSMQRNTPNLPFQLITPGRTFIKRGMLLQVQGSGHPQEREFLLFSDCLVWFAQPGDSSSNGSAWEWSWSGSGASNPSPNASKLALGLPTSASTSSAIPTPPPMVRSRSKSDAHLPSGGDANAAVQHKTTGDSTPDSAPTTPHPPLANRRSHYHAGPAPSGSHITGPGSQVASSQLNAKRHVKNPSASEEKWIYKGKLDLVNMDIVLGTALEDERRIEVLSPEGSFVLYAGSQSERDSWTSDIRSAKDQLLVSLNAMNPNSTLTSSDSTKHVRKALQALPYPPSDERIATLSSRKKEPPAKDAATESGMMSLLSPKVLSSKKKEKDAEKVVEKRRKVEHWVPAVWVPDGKTNACMRCGRTFGWRRRRHHCRLCGRCVCAACSGKTFFIAEVASKTDDEPTGKPARACDACYDSVFPVVDPESLADGRPESSGAVDTSNLASVPNPTDVNTSLEFGAFPSSTSTRNPGLDTIASLAHLPSWVSMPSLPTQKTTQLPITQALMAIDLNSPPLGPRTDDADAVFDGHRVRKMKSHVRVRSTQQIMEDFARNERETPKDLTLPDIEASGSGTDSQEHPDGDDSSDLDDFGTKLGLPAEHDDDDVFFTPSHSLHTSPISLPTKASPFAQSIQTPSPRHRQFQHILPGQRKEDTIRRSKRFSLPAIALHTTNVTARSNSTSEGPGGSSEAMAYLNDALSQYTTGSAPSSSFVSTTAAGMSASSSVNHSPVGSHFAGYVDGARNQSPTRSRVGVARRFSLVLSPESRRQSLYAAAAAGGSANPNRMSMSSTMVERDLDVKEESDEEDDSDGMMGSVALVTRKDLDAPLPPLPVGGGGGESVKVEFGQLQEVQPTTQYHQQHASGGTSASVDAMIVGGDYGLAKGMAVAKLTELLGREPAGK